MTDSQQFDDRVEFATEKEAHQALDRELKRLKRENPDVPPTGSVVLNLRGASAYYRVLLRA